MDVAVSTSDLHAEGSLVANALACEELGSPLYPTAKSHGISHLRQSQLALILVCSQHNQQNIPVTTRDTDYRLPGPGQVSSLYSSTISLSSLLC